MAEQLMFPTASRNPWIEVRDGDDTVRSVFDRHYSRRRYADGRSPILFVGPGEKMVLRTADARAIFVWRRFIEIHRTEPVGINCAVFRNEGHKLSSELINRACDLAWERWPGKRLYTYVDPDKIGSPNPGFCFKAAGWRKCGISKGKLVILERMPSSTAIN